MSIKVLICLSLLLLTISCGSSSGASSYAAYSPTTDTPEQALQHCYNSSCLGFSASQMMANCDEQKAAIIKNIQDKGQGANQACIDLATTVSLDCLANSCTLTTISLAQLNTKMGICEKPYQAQVDKVCQ